MKIERNKHYAVLSNGETICPKDYPKDTQADAENFAQCMQNQVLDVSTSDGMWVHFVKNKDYQSNEIVNAVKSILDDNGFAVFDILNLTSPFPCPQKMAKIGDMSSSEVASLVCKW